MQPPVQTKQEAPKVHVLSELLRIKEKVKPHVAKPIRNPEPSEDGQNPAPGSLTKQRFISILEEFLPGPEVYRLVNLVRAKPTVHEQYKETTKILGWLLKHFPGDSDLRDLYNRRRSHENYCM